MNRLLIGAGKAAELLGVSRPTLNKWASEPELYPDVPRVVERSIKGQRRYDAAEVMLCAENRRNKAA